MIRPLLALAVLALGPAVARAEPCPGCFAVFVMPDVQFYTESVHQPEGAAHLDLVTRWICAWRAGWTEPSTGKQMPIAMVIQLGDLVQGGDFDQDRDGVLEEWVRVDAAFDNLDACPSGPVPYLVIPGNHDYQPKNRYESVTGGFNRYFGPDRWEPYRCPDLERCPGTPGAWFLGSGDPIPAHSRNNADGRPGPPREQPGRHRAGIVRTPSGQRWLFLGLELAFDFPPPAHPAERDDLAWPRALLAAYPGVPTVVFHHALIGPDGGFVEGSADFESDSITSTREIWDRIVAPHDQVLLTFNGHWVAAAGEDGRMRSAREADAVHPTASGLPVHAFFRNYQGLGNQDRSGKACAASYGNGWNVIAAFDPPAGEIRVRTYRIEDADDDCTHDGVPADPLRLRADWRLPEARIAYGFPDARRPEGN